MDVQDVLDEIGTKVATISGLSVFPYTVGKIPAPAAVVGLPDDITYDATYGRGSDTMTIPLWVMVSRANEQAGSADLAAYLAGSGTRSVKAAVDSTNTNEYTSCDEVTVVSAAPGSFTSGGVAFLGAEFTLEIIGSGS